MSQTPPILTITLNPAIDLNLVTTDWSTRDFVRAHTVRRAAGGKGINVSRVLAELDVTSTAACVVGGPDGVVFRSLIDAAPFEVHCIEAGGPTRTNVTVTSDRRARHIKVNQPGARLGRSDWGRVVSELTPLMAGRQWVVLSGALPPGVPATAYAQLTRLAHEQGARVALDCEGPPLLKALRFKPDLVKPNRAELSATLKRPCRSRAAVLEAARKLIASGARRVVVSDGAGACLAVNEKEAWIAQPPRIESGSPMGSGDALLAGVVAGLLAGDPLDAALVRGVACGTAGAASPDTLHARRRDIERYLKQIKAKTL